MIVVVCSTTTVRAADVPNLLLVTTDDQRWDAAGFASDGAYITPGLDRLAARSTHFTRAYAAFALCSPSRAAILTSQYGSTNGVNGLDGPLKKPADSVANHLKAAGYQTGVSGKWHLKTSPADAGFDWAVTFYSNGTWYGRLVDRNGAKVKPPELVDAYCAKESVRFLRERDKSKPFFLWHCSQLPHMDHRHTWPASAASLAKYDAEKIPLPETWKGNEPGKPDWIGKSRNRTQAETYGYDKNPAAIRNHIRDYRATMTDLDDALSPIWKELDDQNLWANTVVVFVSDNGWMLGEHGLTSKVLAYEPSARVPMLVSVPGQTESKKCDRLVMNLDIAPTLLSFARLKPIETSAGRDLRPLLANPAADWRKGIIYEGIGGYGGVPPMGAYVTERWKVIHSWQKKAGGKPSFVELYDMQNDPAEATNRRDDPELSSVQAEADAALGEHRWDGKR